MLLCEVTIILLTFVCCTAVIIFFFILPFYILAIMLGVLS